MSIEFESIEFESIEFESIEFESIEFESIEFIRELQIILILTWRTLMETKNKDICISCVYTLLAIMVSIGLGFSISTIYNKARYTGAIAVATAHEEAAKIIINSVNEHIVSDKSITAILINKLQLLHESDLETITFLRASLKDSIANQMNYAKLVGTGCEVFSNRIDTLEELIKGNKGLITKNTKLIKDKKK